MTFLNPLILFGLAAAAIPLILHLMSLRKLPTVEFSSLTFLKELQRTKIRRLKLRQLLLLILRTLLILLIVLAFARPTLKGSLIEGMGSKAKTTAVILIDDSFSMTAADENGEYFKQANEVTKRILALLDEEDEIHLLPLSAARVQTDRDPGSTGVSSAHLRLAAITPTPLYRPLEDGLRTAAALLSETHNLVKEIYVVSDFQEGLVEDTRRTTAEALVPPDVRVFLAPVGRRSPRNLAIESVSVPNSILETGKPFSFDVTVGNHSGKPAGSVMLSVFLNGTRIAQRGISADDRGTKTSFSVIPRTSGPQELMAELESDDLEFDNRRFLSLLLPEDVQVLVIGEPGTTRYLSLALDTRQESGSVLEQTVIAPAQLGGDILAQTDVVLLASPSGLTSLQADRLNAFVRNGGGLAVFPDDGQSASVSAVYKALDLAPVAAGEQQQAAILEFDRSELSHPLFEGMFADVEESDRNRGLESPRITRAAKLVPSDRSAPIITLSDGSPFLLEQQSERGLLLQFAVAPTLDWSDFPLKGLFVPLIHRSVAYLSQEQTKQPSVLAGESIRFPALQGMREPLRIVTPGNIEGDFKPSPGAGMSFAETNELGIYSVKSPARVVRTFSVNIDPRESRTLRADNDAWIELAESIGIPADMVKIIPEPETVQAAVLQTRYGVELWRHFLIASLLVAVTEMLIARSGRIQEKEALPHD